MNKKLVRGKPFIPGESGNPNGRPLGARSQFSNSFLRDLAASWSDCGPDVLARVAASDPSRYLAVCSTLIPRDVQVSIEQQHPGGLSPDDWQLACSVFQAVKEALPNANSRQPGEVLKFVADAIRSAAAKTIECDTPHHETRTRIKTDT